MKRRMDLNDLENFYRTSVIREGVEHYELVDEDLGIVFELPQDFQVFIDGSVIDPIKFLKMPYHIWDLVFNDRLNPLDASYLCGYCLMMNDRQEEVKMRPGDPMREPNEMNAVMIRAHWDLREQVEDTGWNDQMHELYGEQILWFMRKTDQYGVSGDWYWLLRVDDPNIEWSTVTCLLIQFVRTLRPVYQMAKMMMRRFEEQKENYRRRIVAYLEKLPGRVHWIASTDGDQESRHDANQELWVERRNDWQITQFDDELVIKGRGGSPGVISVLGIRYDEVGLEMSREFVHSNVPVFEPDSQN